MPLVAARAFALTGVAPVPPAPRRLRFRGSASRGVTTDSRLRDRAPSRSPAPPRAARTPADFPPKLEDLAAPFVPAKRTLNEGIADFYDESSELWERVWGEHMHHGYYPGGVPRPDHTQAQVDMIDEALRWAGIDDAHPVASLLDVGCGIGGSSRHIARRFPECVSEGVTLSPVQSARANAITANAGFASRVHFRVADALRLPFPDDAFDLVWSMESAEHMPDKPRLTRELSRACAPGGKVLVVTWCHRELEPGETALRPEEQDIIDRVCDAYYLPAWCSGEEYARLFRDAGMEDVRVADWSDEVRPFWRAVIAKALTPRGMLGLLRAGPATIRGGLVMPLMQRGLDTGAVKFNLIVATKPRR